MADPPECRSEVLALIALEVGRREGSWAAKATSDLIIQYLGYHIFLCLEKRLLNHPTAAHALSDAPNQCGPLWICPKAPPKH